MQASLLYCQCLRLMMTGIPLLVVAQDSSRFHRNEDAEAKTKTGTQGSIVGISTEQPTGLIGATQSFVKTLGSELACVDETSKDAKLEQTKRLQAAYNAWAMQLLRSKEPYNQNQIESALKTAIDDNSEKFSNPQIPIVLRGPLSDAAHVLIESTILYRGLPSSSGARPEDSMSLIRFSEMSEQRMNKWREAWAKFSSSQEVLIANSKVCAAPKAPVTERSIAAADSPESRPPAAPTPPPAPSEKAKPLSKGESVTHSMFKAASDNRTLSLKGYSESETSFIMETSPPEERQAFIDGSKNASAFNETADYKRILNLSSQIADLKSQRVIIQALPRGPDRDRKIKKYSADFQEYFDEREAIYKRIRASKGL